MPEPPISDAFDAHRPRLQALAFRMLGSLAEADDAVQDAWLRLSRTDAASVDNLGGWLTTVVSRVCLDALRTRAARREEPTGEADLLPAPDQDPEQQAQLADAVGLALLVVLERLAPAERVAFVLHDVFDLPFDEVARVVDRSPAAARQLASRARRRVRGTPPEEVPSLGRRREVAEAFLSAARAGDLAGLVAILDPDVVFHADAAAVAMGGASNVHGAAAVADAFRGRAGGARTALVDGDVGLVVAPGGHLLLVLRLTLAHGRIVGIEAVADASALGEIELGVLDG